jgi:hypothetical protein
MSARWRLVCAPHAFVISLLLVLAFVIGAGCAPSDPDVVYFVEHQNGGREWLESLPEKRQVDMFFASHRTRPSSFLVDLWIVESEPTLLPSLRRALDERGQDFDVDAYLRIVEASSRRGVLVRPSLEALDIGPLCARTNSRGQICDAR